MMESLKSYFTVNLTRSISLLLFCCFSVAVQAAPTFSLAFSPATIGSGNETILTYTIDNSSEGVGALNLDFTNTLPANVAIASFANSSTSCSDASISAPRVGAALSVQGQPGTAEPWESIGAWQI